MKSDSYKPADCECLDDTENDYPCWGEVLDAGSGLYCEGHIGSTYTPEPSAEVAALKAEAKRLRNERDALIDAQIVKHSDFARNGVCFVTGSLTGAGPVCLNDAVRLVRKRAGLPETEPTT